MKNFIFLLIGSLFFVSCESISGNGNVISEKRNIPEIRAVKNSGSIDVEINSGENFSVSVECKKFFLLGLQKNGFEFF